MSGKPQTIIEKIWNKHVVYQTEGHPTLFAIDLQLLHEVTSAQAFDVLRERTLPVAPHGRFVATLDHSIPTRKDRENIHDPSARNQVETLRRNVEEFEIPFFDYDSGYQGIVHMIGPELGLTQPGMTIVCGDSHTATHGAFGALAFGVGTTEVGLVLSTGCILQQQPKTMRVNFVGDFQPGVYAKDAILKLIATVGVGGGIGHVAEYAGPAIEKMTMEERMTICNMSIEWGARAGLVAPDTTTLEYIQGKPYAPKDEDWDRAKKLWMDLRSDEGATYDKEITINLDKLEPMVTWGTNPAQGIGISEHIPYLHELPEDDQVTARKSLDYVQLNEGDTIEKTPIQWAFLGSCTNARLQDLRIAASLMKGKQIAEGVSMLVVPGSEQVKAEAEAEGLNTIFEQSGAQWRMPGCSACLGMNDDKIPPGERCISTSNRNFVGRQGPGSRTHLASPATVAASALKGCITSPVAHLHKN